MHLGVERRVYLAYPLKNTVQNGGEITAAEAGDIWPHWAHIQETKPAQEVRQYHKTQGPHLETLPQAKPQIAPPVGDQVFRHMSFWGTFHIQSTACMQQVCFFLQCLSASRIGK